MTIKNYSKQCLMISAGIMVLALLLSLFGMGINVGIDFSGGMSMQYTMAKPSRSPTSRVCSTASV